MRNILFCLSIGCAVLFSGFIPKSEEDEFIRSVFAVVKSQDSMQFKKLLITSEEIFEAISKSTWSEEKKEKDSKKVTPEFLDRKASENFHLIQEKTEVFKMDWKKAEIDSISSSQQVTDGMPML